MHIFPLIVPDHVVVSLTAGANSGPLIAGLFYSPTVVAAVCTATLGLVGAISATCISKKSKEKELFQSALQHLTGKSQNRSVGISIIKDYAERYNVKEMVSTIFIAQMLHLYDSGYGREDATNRTISIEPRKIEEFNFYVMKNALEAWGLPSVGQCAAEVARPLNIPRSLQLGGNR